LRGHKFDIPKAAQKLDASIKFRFDNNLPELRKKAEKIQQTEFPHYDRLIKCYPHNIHHKTDKKGQPLSLERIGHTDPAALTKLLTLEQLLEYQFYHLENKAALVARLSRERGVVMRVSKVLDLSGLGIRALHRQGLSYLQTCIRMGQDNYPEMLGNLYIINAPWLFKSLWAIVKPWLEPATLEKITVLGADYATVLRERIDPNDLPDWAGGECTDCKDGCVVDIDPDTGMTELPVTAKSVETIKFPIKSEGAHVSWEFRTVSRDIGFRADFISANGDTVSVEPDTRPQSHKINVRGSYAAPSAGTLQLTFDNTFSRWTGKTVKYKVDIVNKSDEALVAAAAAAAEVAEAAQ
jgi:phosphatidylinositol/phosphatidylcholine transfer protein